MIAPLPSASLGRIQILRGVAASLVVVHHSARAFTIHRPGAVAYPHLFSGFFFLNFLSFGVDIFFVISGFIMVYVSKPYVEGRKPPHDFLVRRFLRIYPMYALVTVVVCLLNLRYFGPDIPDLKPNRIIDSLLFIPSFDSNCEIFPILGVGWTLFYEMFFYLTFTLSLAFARNSIVPALIAILLAIVVTARLFGDHGALAEFFKNTIVFEFALGCLIGGLFVAGRLPPLHPLIFFGLAAVLLTPQLQSPLSPNDYRFLFWGLPAALIVTGVLAIEARARRAVGPLALSFGDASYVIYLVHVIIIYDLVSKLVERLDYPIANGFVTDALISACALVAIAGGWLLHLVVEKPLRRGLSDWYSRFATKAAVAAKT